MSKHFWGFPDTLPSQQQNIAEQRQVLERQISLAQAQLSALNSEPRIYEAAPDRSHAAQHDVISFVGMIPMKELGATKDESDDQ